MTPPMCRIVVKKSINEGFLPEKRSVVRGVWASFQTHWSVLHFFCYKWYVLSGLHPLKGSFPFKLGRAEMIISCVIQKRSTQKSEAGIAPVWLRQVRNGASDFFLDVCQKTMSLIGKRSERTYRARWRSDRTYKARPKGKKRKVRGWAYDSPQSVG